MRPEERRIACKECRQQKVKCSGDEGKACARCAQRGLECVMDSDYKRTSKRKRLAMLEEEMARFKSQMRSSELSQDFESDRNADGLQENTPPVQSPSAGAYALPEPLFVPVKRPVAPQAPSPMILSWDSPPRTADGFTLPSATISALFREFVDHYHPTMPVVDVSRGPSQIYDLSPALFWTVMAVAARRSEDPLPQKLSTIERACLSDIAVSPVTRFANTKDGHHFNLPTVYAVQALLISTLWPLPTSSINADASWNTSGIAIFTAMRAGMHCPGHQQDFERIFKSVHPNQARLGEQLVTWLCANSVAQAVASVFGYPSISNFYYNDAVRSAGATEAIPIRVRRSFAIQAIANQIETTLGSSLGQRTSLIRILASRIDEFEADNGHELDARSWFALLAERWHLYCYYLFDDDMPVAQQQMGITALYNASLNILDHVVRSCEGNDTYAKYMPLVDVQQLWQVASVVARLWHSEYGKFLDKAAGSRLFRNIVGIVAQASIFEHDVPFRAAEIMPQMWSAFGKLAAARNPKILCAQPQLRSRMAASLFFDCLWTMREVAEIDSHAPTQLTKRSATGTSPALIGTPPTPADGPTMVEQTWEWDFSNGPMYSWREVDTFMENFGFGLGELPYVSPPSGV